MSPEIRLYLLVRAPGLSPKSVIICRSVSEAREEWFLALRADPLSSGFLHCGESRPDFDEIEPFLRTGRMVVSDSARQVLPDSLTPAFTVLGFLKGGVARRMKVFELTRGWLPGDERDSLADSRSMRVCQPVTPPASALPDAQSLVVAITDILGRRTESQVRALKARLGVDGRRCTLEEAGAAVGITRERVRQLEVRFIQKFLDTPVSTEFAARIQSLRISMQAALRVKDLPRLDTWFAGLAPESDLVRTLLPPATHNALHVIESPEGDLICSTSVPSWDELLRTALDAVRAVEIGGSRDSVIHTIRELVTSLGARELLSAVLAKVEEQVHYSDDGTTLAFGDTHPVIVEAILRASDRPLHYTEVAKRWPTRFGEPIDPLAAHRALQRSSSVRLLGRGMYGLDKHIGIPTDTLQAIISDCEFIMTNARLPRQWHTSELLSVLQNMRHDLPDSIDKYVLDASLTRSSVVCSVGRLVWAVREPGSETSKRIDMRDAAVEVLKRVGRPLSDTMLRAEIMRERGLDRVYFFLVPTCELARISPGVWGLVERDFGLDENKRHLLPDEMHSILRARGSALHSSEVAAALADRIELPDKVTGYMIQQLAALDPRIKLYHGELIGLAEWGEPRRLTIRGAMQGIATSLDGEVTLDFLHRELERIAQRSIARQAVYSIVASSDLTYDAERKVWRRADRDDDGDASSE